MQLNNFKKTFFIIVIVNIIFLNLLHSQTEQLQKRKLTKAFSYIQDLYIDSVSEEEIVENAIIGMLEDLDPHSQYISKENVKMIEEPLKGNFDGIGIQFQILDDTLYVINTLKSGPAAKNGILPGDRIILLENENIAGIGLSEFDARLKFLGIAGTKLNIGIKRFGSNSLLNFTIRREKLPIKSIEASYLVNNKTGYIKLNNFSATTVNEFNKVMSNFLAHGIENLILDIRGNGGGYLKTAVDICDHFIGEEKLIVFTEGKHSLKEEKLANISGYFENGRLTILINEGSASASEIVAGAVQDWDRGVIIGRRSFGKGLVQRPLSLPDGSKLRLTIAQYYTPSGRSIQKPYNNGNEDYNHELIERYNHGELLNKDSIHFPDSLKFETLISKRTVYGGGGIMPDIFIPIDTNVYTNYYQELLDKGIINLYSLNYANKNRELFKQAYPTFDRYIAEFDISEEMFGDFLVIAKKNEISFNEKEFQRSKTKIRNRIIALIALNVFDLTEYYQIVNKEDLVFQKAIKVLSDKKLYKKVLSGK